MLKQGAYRVDRALSDLDANMRYPIGVTSPLDGLEAEFAHSPEHVRKIQELVQHGYTHHRRVRGDGNCFYRTMGFLWLEQLCARASRSGGGEATIELPLEQCTCPGLEEELEDLCHALRALLRGEASAAGQGCWTSYLCHRLMVDPRFDLSVVLVIRQLVAQFIWHGAEGAAGLLDFLPMGAEQFLKDTVLPMGVEAEGVVMRAAAEVLGIHLTIVHLDGKDGAIPEYHYPSEMYSSPFGLHAFMLFRPGHYEVLYRDGNHFFVDPESMMGRCSCCHAVECLRMVDLRPCFHRLCATCSAQAATSQCSACSEGLAWPRSGERTPLEQLSNIPGADDAQAAATALSNSAQQILEQTRMLWADIPALTGSLRRQFQSRGPRIEPRQPIRSCGDRHHGDARQAAGLVGCLRAAEGHHARKNNVRFTSEAKHYGIGMQANQDGRSERQIRSQTQEAIARALDRHAALKHSSKAAHAGCRCRTAGCKYFGTKATEGLCSSCFAKSFANEDDVCRDGEELPQVPDKNPTPKAAPIVVSQAARATGTSKLGEEGSAKCSGPGKQQAVWQVNLSGDCDPMPTDPERRRQAAVHVLLEGSQRDLDQTECRVYQDTGALPLDETVADLGRRAHWFSVAGRRQTDGPRRASSACPRT
mmetsp:Transcript_3798/g.6382  ORF Transcript_3798/g.6382 Transcript_3798/m.6382 type:complete len:646 (+) Transcript_3798:48-1985(+)